MTELFLKIVNMSISASWLVLIIVALRFLLKKTPKWLYVLLWALVAVRLICPFSLESALSLLPSAQTISPEILLDTTPEITTGIAPIDDAINPVISQSNIPEPGGSINPLQIHLFILQNVWLIGMLMLFIYTAGSYLSLRSQVTEAIPLGNRIYQCEAIDSPFVLGFLRPKIYLPFSMEERDISSIIEHEQAHIQRRDHWWKPLGFLLLSLHWFNPLMWLAYILLCRDIEMACDEKVVQKLNKEQRADYSQALLNCSINRRRIAACPLAFGETGVKTRVKSVLHYEKPTFWIILTGLIACIVLAVCFLTNPEIIEPFDYAQKTLQKPERMIVWNTNTSLSYGTDSQASIPQPTNEPIIEVSYEADSQIYQDIYRILNQNWWKYAETEEESAADEDLAEVTNIRKIRTTSDMRYVNSDQYFIDFIYSEPLKWHNEKGKVTELDNLRFVLPKSVVKGKNVPGYVIAGDYIYTYYYTDEILETLSDDNARIAEYEIYAAARKMDPEFGKTDEDE